MPTLRLDLEYDGSRFRGWAAQPGLRTVQGELEAALGTVLGEPIRLNVAGRTDAGVHAWGQVAGCVSAAAPPADLASALNGVGAEDLAVLAAFPVRDGFDARRDALSRSYCYRLLARPSPSPFERGRALWWPHHLDRGALAACACSLRGSHDFTAFTPAQSDHVRFDREIIAAEWVSEGDILCFRITADAFMRKMVRILVGTMLEVASDKRSLSNFESLLKGAHRRDAGETAPPHGLYLESVSYGCCGSAERSAPARPQTSSR